VGPRSTQGRRQAAEAEAQTLLRCTLTKNIEHRPARAIINQCLHIRHRISDMFPRPLGRPTLGSMGRVGGDSECVFPPSTGRFAALPFGCERISQLDLTFLLPHPSATIQPFLSGAPGLSCTHTPSPPIFSLVWTLKTNNNNKNNNNT